MEIKLFLYSISMVNFLRMTEQEVAKPKTLEFDPFIWKSEPIKDCPFRQKEKFAGIRLLGIEIELNPPVTHYGLVMQKFEYIQK